MPQLRPSEAHVAGLQLPDGSTAYRVLRNDPAHNRQAGCPERSPGGARPCWGATGLGRPQSAGGERNSAASAEKTASAEGLAPVEQIGRRRPGRRHLGREPEGENLSDDDGVFDGGDHARVPPSRMPTDPTPLYRLRDGAYAADLLIVAVAHLDPSLRNGAGVVDAPGSGVG